jgi:hypothetical protein
VFSTIIIPIMIYGFVATYKYVHRDDITEETENKNQEN